VETHEEPVSIEMLTRDLNPGPPECKVMELTNPPQLVTAVVMKIWMVHAQQVYSIIQHHKAIQSGKGENNTINKAQSLKKNSS
jgi:hypothetical protein